MSKEYDIGRDVGFLQAEYNKIMDKLEELQKQVNDMRSWILKHEKESNDEKA